MESPDAVRRATGAVDGSPACAVAVRSRELVGTARWGAGTDVTSEGQAG